MRVCDSVRIQQHKITNRTQNIEKRKRFFSEELFIWASANAVWLCDAAAMFAEYLKMFPRPENNNNFSNTSIYERETFFSESKLSFVHKSWEILFSVGSRIGNLNNTGACRYAIKAASRTKASKDFFAAQQCSRMILTSPGKTSDFSALYPLFSQLQTFRFREHHYRRSSRVSLLPRFFPDLP